MEAVGVEVAADTKPALPALAGSQLLDGLFHQLALGGAPLGALLVAERSTSFGSHEDLLVEPAPDDGRSPTRRAAKPCQDREGSTVIGRGVAYEGSADRSAAGPPPPRCL